MELRLMSLLFDSRSRGMTLHQLALSFPLPSSDNRLLWSTARLITVKGITILRENCFVATIFTTNPTWTSLWLHWFYCVGSTDLSRLFTRGVTFQTEKRNYSDIRHFKQMSKKWKQRHFGTGSNLKTSIENINHLTPNDPYMCRTAPLTSKRSFYIFIQQI
jgi:hypothetical protein